MLHTNELRNINIDQLKKNTFMKPKINPIHKNYIDSKENIFNKFLISDSNFYADKGHNIIYKTDTFTLRISKCIIPIEDVDDVSLKKIIKLQIYDEKILLQAVKKNITPQVYFIGNILYNGNMHRFYILQTYQFSLSTFIKNNYNYKILQLGYFKNNEEIYEEITNQLILLFQDVIDLQYVYYDIKPENAVININTNGTLTLKLIDFDNEWCIKEEWLENNKDIIVFINILIMAYGCYYYLNNNIFYKYIQQEYNLNRLELISRVISNLNNEYYVILISYFWFPFNMENNQVENFENKKDEYKIEFLKKKTYFMFQESCSQKNILCKF